MKTIVITIIFLIQFFPVLSQYTPESGNSQSNQHSEGFDWDFDIPNSFINFGVGAGMNYGMIGTKTVFGYHNSGLLLGLGISPNDGSGAYEIGGQIGINWFYANIGYGTCTYQLLNVSPYPQTCGSIVFGGMIGLGSEKRFFIDLGLGHTFASSFKPFQSSSYFGSSSDIKTTFFTYTLGLGYRFGDFDDLKKSLLNSSEAGQ